MNCFGCNRELHDDEWSVTLILKPSNKYVNDRNGHMEFCQTCFAESAGKDYLEYLHKVVRTIEDRYAKGTGPIPVSNGIEYKKPNYPPWPEELE